MPRAAADDSQPGPDAGEERLQRILSAAGVSSRRGAEELIAEGRVKVNGRTITTPGSKANPFRDVIKVDGRTIQLPQTRILMLNKPTGYITTTSDERSRRTVMDLVSVPERVYPVGRLDRDTEGLLLLTNAGDIANRVMHPRYRLDKEYRVTTDRRPTQGQLRALQDGIMIDDRLITPSEIRIVREGRDGVVLGVTIHQGINRLVRRMMEGVDIPVVRLQRIRIGPISIEGLATGQWRDLRPGEAQSLQEAVHLTGQGPAKGRPDRRRGSDQ